MASINAEIRQRLNAVKDVARYLKSIITLINKFNRWAKAISLRKKTLPDENDLVRLLALLADVVKAIQNLSSLPAKLTDIWKF
jgi:small-conductance mechanosensitive channel